MVRRNADVCAELLVCIVDGKEVFIAEVVNDPPERGESGVRWGGEAAQILAVDDEDDEWLYEEDEENDRKECWRRQLVLVWIVITFELT